MMPTVLERGVRLLSVRPLHQYTDVLPAHAARGENSAVELPPAPGLLRAARQDAFLLFPKNLKRSARTGSHSGFALDATAGEGGMTLTDADRKLVDRFCVYRERCALRRGTKAGRPA